MAITITNRPDKEISSGYTSRWIAINGGYPVFFTFYRKDYALTSVQDDGNGFVQLRVGSNITTELEAGQAVYFLSATLGGKNATITNYSYNGAHTLIQTDALFTGSTDTDAGNYVNLLGARPDFRLYIQIYGKPDNELLFEGAYSPASSGKYELDVSGAITPHVSLALSQTYAATNQANEETTQPFYIQYAEYYNGSLYDYEADLYLYRGVNCANQILYSYDTNLGDRVAFNDDITPKAKWLSVFDSPRIWPGYPFALGVIFEAEGNSPVITREEEKFTELGVSAGTTSTTLAGSEFAYINEVNTTVDAMASTVYSFDMWLESDLTGNPCSQLAALTQAQKWNFIAPTILGNNNTIFAIRIQRNPLSGISSIDTFPNMTVSDGTNSYTYAYSSGKYYATGTLMAVVAGQTYTFTIASLDVTIYGTSCTTSFSQSWTNGTSGGGAYSDGYSEGFD